MTHVHLAAVVLTLILFSVLILYSLVSSIKVSSYNIRPLLLYTPTMNFHQPDAQFKRPQNATLYYFLYILLKKALHRMKYICFLL